MRNLWKHLVAIQVGALFLIAAPASGQVIEVGKLPGIAPMPSCPAGDNPNDCLVLTRSTVVQIQAGKYKDPFVVPEDGRIVAWSVSLSKPSKNEVSSFSDRFGKSAQAGIAVLQPVKALKKKKVRGKIRKYWVDEKKSKLIAHTPIQKLDPFFGQTVQFPLEQSIPVKKGQQLGLSVPTWAPVLAINMGTDSQWRTSRPESLATHKDGVYHQSVHQSINSEVSYKWIYQFSRVLYSVTVITDPKPTPVPKPSPPPKSKTTVKPKSKPKPTTTSQSKAKQTPSKSSKSKTTKR